MSITSTGFVQRAYGNLISVIFDRTIRQGEVAYVVLPDERLKAEVLEIAGNEAKLQVFEDTREIVLGTPVEFTGNLLEAELGPGLLSNIYDGLQSPLEEVASKTGYFLPRGFHSGALNRETKWEFVPVTEERQSLTRGETLGTVTENTVDEVIAKAVDEKGKEISFTMLQRWPIKNQLIEGVSTKPTKMMDTGMRIIDTQFPVLKGGTFCSPGPFGAGKTLLQHHLAKFSCCRCLW
jgi:V/A-type H+-transporting ATPase subunit A